jgi:hypothetical protein
MNKKFFGFIAVIVIAVVAAFSISVGDRKEVLSSVALENAEASAGDSVYLIQYII